MCTYMSIYKYFMEKKIEMLYFMVILHHDFRF